MAMCIHSQEYETCSFGCTFKKAKQLRLENDLLHEYIETNRITHLKERIEELKVVIRAALRISDLWTLKEVESMFEDEAKALETMKRGFEQALKEKP